MLRQLTEAEALPDDQEERPVAFYEALEALAVFYVWAERLDAARPYWEEMWKAFPASCWTRSSFEEFAYRWFYYVDGEGPEDWDLFTDDALE